MHAVTAASLPLACLSLCFCRALPLDPPALLTLGAGAIYGWWWMWMLRLPRGWGPLLFQLSIDQTVGAAVVNSGFLITLWITQAAVAGQLLPLGWVGQPASTACLPVSLHHIILSCIHAGYC